MCEQTVVLSALERGEADVIEARRIGRPLIVERLWRESGCQAAIEALLIDRAFAFPVERAVFLTEVAGQLGEGAPALAAGELTG